MPIWKDKFPSLFNPSNASKLPVHRPFDCAIELHANAILPPPSKIIPLSLKESQILREYIDEMLKKGFITPSKSIVASPIFFVAKADGGLRPCVDYRKINSITIPDLYPLPLIQSIFEGVGNAKFFSKIDLQSAYNLVRIREGDEWKTAFRCSLGQFECRVMPFGLVNAPAIFQKFINFILSDLIGIFVFVYLDDILIFSKTEQLHQAHVHTVLSRLAEAELLVKESKCLFNVEKLEFLGHLISGNNISTAPSKIDALNNWELPKTKRETQSFIGFANYYRKFIKDFSNIARPIQTCINHKPGLTFQFSPEASIAFDQIRTELRKAPPLHLPDQTLQFIIETDASDWAAGAVLLQRKPGSSRNGDTVSFFSKTFSETKRRYSTFDKELLAIKMALNHWRHL
jgi:Reverse transcriptase (RNA-dependent DNA polymerase)/RNase H-like domain found in reverse transcriptase